MAIACVHRCATAWSWVAITMAVPARPTCTLISGSQLHNDSLP